MIETQVRYDDWDVDRRLIEMGLDKERLSETVEVALSASLDSTPFHPANAAGMLAYIYGTWSLRNQFVGNGWVVDRVESLEAIRNDTTKLKVIYSNVDIAANKEHGPKPRSKKGAGSERACNGTLFDDLPQFAPRQDEEYETYFLMVDERGAAELTRPVIVGGTYHSYIERIFLFDGETGLNLRSNFGPDRDIADDFDPEVVRK